MITTEPPTVKPPSNVPVKPETAPDPEIVVAPAIEPALLIPALLLLIPLTESPASSSNPLLPAPPIVKDNPDNPAELEHAPETLRVPSKNALPAA